MESLLTMEEGSDLSCAHNFGGRVMKTYRVHLWSQQRMIEYHGLASD